MIIIRHTYDIEAWKTNIVTAGHKEEIISHGERERRETLGENIPNDGEQEQLVLASFFTVKGTVSGFARPLSKKEKHGRKNTETSSGKSMEVAEVALYAAMAGYATELLVPIIIYQFNNVTLPLEITNHIMLFIVVAGQILCWKIQFTQ